MGDSRFHTSSCWLLLRRVHGFFSENSRRFMFSFLAFIMCLLLLWNCFNRNLGHLPRYKSVPPVTNFAANTGTHGRPIGGVSRVKASFLSVHRWFFVVLRIKSYRLLVDITSLEAVCLYTSSVSCRHTSVALSVTKRKCAQMKQVSWRHTIAKEPSLNISVNIN